MLPTFPVPMTALANINVLGALANVSGEVGKQTSTFITVQVRQLTDSLERFLQPTMSSYTKLEFLS